MTRLGYLSGVGAVFFPAYAFAQCAQGLLVNCLPPTNLQGTDIAYCWQTAQTPHSRACTITQMASVSVALTFASPPVIGSTTPNSGFFVNLSATGNVTAAGVSASSLSTFSSITISSLFNSGLSTFSGLATFGSITASALFDSGLSTFSGLATFNGGVTASALFDSGLSTFSGLATFNSGITASSLYVTGQSTLSGTVTIGANTIALGSSGTFYPGHSLIGVQTFCASGCTHTSGTYTADSGTNQVLVEVQAPGGGSGGCAATLAGQACASGGAGSGAYEEALVTSAFSGVTVTVGAAGSAGTTGGNGGTGGTVSFGSIISCPGGNGSAGSSGATVSAFVAWGSGASPGSSCTVSGGTKIKTIQGQSGDTGVIAASTGGAQFSGAGAPSALGQGGVPVSSSTVNSGAAATGYGAGPSGAVSVASQAGTVGTTGSVGIVVIYEFN